MSNNFEPLRADEVVSVEDDLKILINHPTFKVIELKDALIKMLNDYDYIFREGKKDEKAKWFFIKGINAQVLRHSANGWQKGKVRINLEFCPDEPEVKKKSISNPPETSEPESPLDEIRRMQG